MVAVASEIPMCTARQSCLVSGDIGDLDVECGEKIIEASCRARVVPARLNFGDCFSYALAKDHDEPLLWKGDGFGHTDVRRA